MYNIKRHLEPCTLCGAFFMEQRKNTYQAFYYYYFGFTD
jgi:hypothetical protein